MIGQRFADVLASAQHGDEGAFDVLWRDTNPALLRYLRVLAPDAAQDLAAETWLSVVRGIRKFRGDELAWRGWIFTIARRRATDETRRSIRRPVSRLPDEPDGWLPAERDSADVALQNLDTRAALDLVAALPPVQAEVIMLRVVAGLPVEEVAKLVGRSPGAVRVAAHRGLRGLAAALATAGVTR